MIDESTLSQEEFIKSKEQVFKIGELSEDYKLACRTAASEGIIMLENNGVLPLDANVNLSVFGRVQHNYFFVGYGSGGDVFKPYAINLMEGLKANSHFNINLQLNEVYRTWCLDNIPDDGDWGTWPTHYDEMPLTEELVEEAASFGEYALVVIGRSAGEARECILAPGSYYLTDEEKNMLDFVTAKFNKVIVLINSGNAIDMSWVSDYENKIGAILLVWQGGMESGNAIADILSGITSPSGRLTSTIACNYKDYPSSENFGGEVYNNYIEDIYVGYRYFETFAKEAVLYPFGYGLSYSEFELQLDGEILDENGKIYVPVKVTNIGSFLAKQVVQVYYSAPQGRLGKPAIELAGFSKTKNLTPGQSEVVTISFDKSLLASYDDAGKTGHKSAWVLEAGEYKLFIGSDIRKVKEIGAIEQDSLRVVEQLTEAVPVNPQHCFDRLIPSLNKANIFEKAYEPVPTRTIDLKERILNGLPSEIKQTSVEINFDDVVAKKSSLEEFVGTLSIDELDALTRGEGAMNSLLGPPGNAGCFGGVTPSLREKGVEAVATSDGPSGIRLQYECALIPIGVCLASTWNTSLLEKLAKYQGQELTEKGSHVLLSPGMNIMRDPLCGRNFEYFSEDPILSGRAASAIVLGLQTHGYSACPKHFACNNQEQNRNKNDSRLSERALREIYLKGFEICVKESSPKNIMTSYNKINGVWGHYHYELCKTILRDEWGYEGNVITDWWMQPAEDPDFNLLTNCAYQTRAWVDVLMPGGSNYFVTKGDGSLLESYYKGGIALAEIQRSALSVLKFVLDVKEKPKGDDKNKVNTDQVINLRYTNLMVDKERIKDTETVQVSLQVKNTRDVAGKGSVQLYVQNIEGTSNEFTRELKGAQEVELAPSEEKQIHFTLERKAFAYYDTDLKDWYTEEGKYQIEVGRSSRDIRLTKEIYVEPSIKKAIVFTRDTLAGKLMTTDVGRQLLQKLASERSKSEGSTEMIESMIKELPIGIVFDLAGLEDAQIEEIMCSLNKFS